MVKIIRHRRHNKLGRMVTAAILIIVLLTGGAGGSLLYARPLPSLSAQPVSLVQPEPAGAVDMPWPAYGQAAVGLAGNGILATSTSGTQKPLPTASVAKTMTALAVLDKKPLSPGEAGPTITITQQDVDIWSWYLNNDGSNAKVELGEQISQYDALQALMLPSANNFADTLAIWAFGSMENYVEYANKLAGSFGMENSHFADPSGFSPLTVSTADDLIRLGDHALQNPVLMEIFAKRQADIPVAGTIYNVNGLLGKYGINGIKTGNTDEAGGVFLVSAKRQLADGQEGTIIACVMGGPNLDASMLATLPLLDATAANMVSQTVVKKGQSFGSFSAPWSSQTVKAVATKDITINTWKDSNISTTASLKALAGPQAKGADAGKATVTVGNQTVEVPLVLDGAITAPSAWWRISHR